LRKKAKNVGKNTLKIIASVPEAIFWAIHWLFPPTLTFDLGNCDFWHAAV
jgi:hypothetical protein